MERFIRDENIRRYRRLLEEEQDEEKRNAIRKLLAEEAGRAIKRPILRKVVIRCIRPNKVSALSPVSLCVPCPACHGRILKLHE
jgi:hypothetical protein